MAGWLSGKLFYRAGLQRGGDNQSTARDLERQLTIRLDKFKERERLFENSSILVIYVIDDNYNHVDAHSAPSKVTRASRCPR
jgi:hypothetical protein